MNHDIFYAKGILGKSLGLSKNGEHVAFLAGTGVLVFMDLVALISRFHLGILNNDPLGLFAKESTFKLVLFVSFPDESHSIGLDLLRSLHSYCQKNSFTTFELILRLSNNQPNQNILSSTRWTEEYLKEQIDKRKNIARVYVCGPPKMNELMERAMKKTKLRKEQIYIM